MQGTILVATAGQGILRSVDDGASWHRLGLKEAIEFDGTVRSLAAMPAPLSTPRATCEAMTAVAPCRE